MNICVNLSSATVFQSTELGLRRDNYVLHRNILFRDFMLLHCKEHCDGSFPNVVPSCRMFLSTLKHSCVYVVMRMLLPITQITVKQVHEPATWINCSVLEVLPSFVSLNGDAWSRAYQFLPTGCGFSGSDPFSPI